MFTSLRLNRLLRLAYKHAYLMDWLGWQSLDKSHFKTRDDLQLRIKKLQEEAQIVAPFNGLIKEWFPEVAMMPLRGRVSRRIFKGV